MDVSTRPKFRTDIEIIRGMDNHPLAYDPATGAYHRLSESAVKLVRHLDGEHSITELSTVIASGRRVPPEKVQAELDLFVRELGEGGLLEGAAAPAGKSRTGRLRLSMLMPRFVLSRSMPRLLEPLARVLRRIPPLPVVAIFAAGGLAGVAFGLFRIAQGASGQLLGWAAAAAVGLFLVQVLVHESAHAVVAQVLRVPVRGFGVALLFFFMPLAYVDRTDAYRLRGRGGRVLLALAGPLADGWAMGATGIVSGVAHGSIGTLAAALLIIQGLSLATNANPLLPSDGYSAIEAATGLVDPRGRSLALVRHVVRRQPLPSYLAHQTPAARRAYLAYGGVCLAYIGVLGYFMLGNILHAVAAVRGSLGR